MKFDFNDKKHELINLRNSKPVHATIINSYSEEIDLPIIQKIAKDGKRMDLSDDSVWFSKDGKFKKWQQGNRVIISSLDKVTFDTSTHILINLDKSTEDKDSQTYRATLVK